MRKESGFPDEAVVLFLIIVILTIHLQPLSEISVFSVQGMYCDLLGMFGKWPSKLNPI